MDWITIALLGVIFLFTASLVFSLYRLWAESRFAKKKVLKKRLMYLSAGGGHGEEKFNRFREKTLQDAAFIEKLAMRLPRIPRLDQLLLKSGLGITPTVFLLICATLAAVGILVGFLFKRGDVAAILAFVGVTLPYFVLLLRERQFLNKFEEQLPEALDLLGRAMRSGHALSSGLEMVANEMTDPLKSEFSVTVDEVNLGLTFKEAFDNLCSRVESTDLAFFATATLIQRETGGNIAEILDNTSKLIRERLPFRREVKPLTAEGRLSAWILIALPIIMFVYIYFVNYEYISQLWIDPLGHYMVYGGVILQVIGIIVINRIVKIDI